LSFDCPDRKVIVPPYLAISTLRPEPFRPFELTSPCEENVESRHRKKLEKYAFLCSEISRKGWKVNSYAVEIGARGFCSESIRCCLRSLGFKNRVIKSTLKSLSQIAVRSSFVIWLSRDSKVWDQDFVEDPLNSVPKPKDIDPVPTKVSSTSTKVPPSRSPSASVPLQEEKTVNRKLCGLVNKGNL